MTTTDLCEQKTEPPGDLAIAVLGESPLQHMGAELFQREASERGFTLGFWQETVRWAVASDRGRNYAATAGWPNWGRSGRIMA